MNKAIKKAGGHIENGEREIWKAIKAKDKEYLKVVFETIKDMTESETKVASIIEMRTYIFNHFDSIKNQYESDYIGCSAEGHISHIYSDRLSSRPLGWSKEGVDQMARLRVFRANGGNVYDLTLKKKQKKIREARITALNLKVAKKSWKKVSGETIDNLPAFNQGKRTQLAIMLRGIRGI